jgi:tellurite resistance protein
MHLRSRAAAAEAPARALAAMVAANGRIDEREMRALAGLDAFRRLGVTRQRLVDLASQCLAEVGAQLCDRLWLNATDTAYLNALLDAVGSREERLLVCRLAAAVITADGRVTRDERLVYDHALTRWQISQAMVTEAIRRDRRRLRLMA